MPIEIKELHIRVAVNVPHGDQPSKEKKSGVNAGGDKEDLVSECVEQVMQIIQTKTER